MPVQGDSQFSNIYLPDNTRPREIVWGCSFNEHCCGYECCPQSFGGGGYGGGGSGGYGGGGNYGGYGYGGAANNFSRFGLGYVFSIFIFMFIIF